jgi:hypothetical protein
LAAKKDRQRSINRECFKRQALCQGTTSVVPKASKIIRALAPVEDIYLLAEDLADSPNTDWNSFQNWS